MSTLRKDWAGLSCVSDVLRSGGFYDEADRCRDLDFLLQCLDIVEAGRALTVLDDSYPQSWLDTLGAGAPPVFWQVGSPVAPMPAWGVVGSRNLSDGQFRLAQRAGSAILSAGRVLVTGGAVGADSASIYGAVDSGGDGRVAVILPYGVNLVRRHAGVTYWSVCPPSADFSTANAMERNALIYAMSDRTLVVAARLQRGGSWAGAVDAMRRHLCGVTVADWGDDAARALIGLGASPLVRPGFADSDAIVNALSMPSPVAQPELFGFARVRETVLDYGLGTI
ncbi:MAG: DNA-processing protein DprA [Armatimonadetes bacterium]|nr:DNA-processing protein DprA [Armatimonadota bacterium]